MERYDQFTVKFSYQGRVYERLLHKGHSALWVMRTNKGNPIVFQRIPHVADNFGWCMVSEAQLPIQVLKQIAPMLDAAHQRYLQHLHP
jgi:hypothetical protein